MSISLNMIKPVVIFSIFLGSLVPPVSGDTGQTRIVNIPSDDSRVNSRQIIQDAIDSAVNGEENIEIRLGEGIYKVSTDSRSALMVSKSNNITIMGRGIDKTFIVCNNPQAGAFAIQESSNITICDVSIDYDPLPFTQGCIVAVNKDSETFDLRIDNGFDGLDERWYLETNQQYCKWGMIFEPKSKLLKKGSPDNTFISSWQHLGERLWRLKVAKHQTANLEYMSADDRYVHLARGIGIPAIMVYKSRDCVIKNVAVFSSPCEAVTVVESDSLRCDGLKVLVPKESNRLISTDSDAVHCSGNIRGPIIENCYFESMADDTVNIYGRPLSINAVKDDELVIGNLTTAIHIGDCLQIFDAVQGKVYGETVVEQIIELINLSGVVKVDKPLFDSDKPAKLSDVTVYNLSACGQGYVIRNNYIGPHRRHGILVRAGKGLIESNTIHGVGGLGIVVANEPDWPEGPIADDVVIRGNTISEVGYSKGYADSQRSGVITVKGLKSGNELAQGRIQRNITIENNTIIEPLQQAIYIGSARNIIVDNNIIKKSKYSATDNIDAYVVIENTELIKIRCLKIISVETNIKPLQIIEKNISDGAISSFSFEQE